MSPRRPVLKTDANLRLSVALSRQQVARKLDIGNTSKRINVDFGIDAGIRWGLLIQATARTGQANRCVGLVSNDLGKRFRSNAELSDRIRCPKATRFSIGCGEWEVRAVILHIASIQ